MFSSTQRHTNYSTPTRSSSAFTARIAKRSNCATSSTIPQKQIKPRHVLPWVTHRIHKLVRAKQRLHSKLRQHHCPNNLNKYKEARHTLPREIRKSYWTYLENIIDYTNDEQDRHTKQNKIMVLHKANSQRLLCNPHTSQPGRDVQ